MKRTTQWVISLTLPCLLIACLARESHSQSLQEALEDLDVGDRWQYNDWDAAKAAAAKSRKPILALFR